MSKAAVTVATQDVVQARKRVLALAGPSLAEQFLVSFVSMADMMMVGRLGPAAITSVGLTNQPIMFFQAVFMALNVGTTALVARLFGARDTQRASDAAKQTLVVALLSGVAMSLLSVALAGPILRFMGAEPDVLELGVSYFRWVGAGLVFNALALNMTASLRGAGDTKSPMTINVIANVFHVITNYLLIYGPFGLPALGVVGAGVSTTLTRALSFVLFYNILASGSKRIKISFREGYALDWPLLKRAFTVGLPAAGEQLILRSGQVTFARVVSGLGTVTYAAHQVGMNVLSMSFQPGQAFAVAATTLVGQGLGAERPDQAEIDVREARRLGVIVGCSMAALFFFFGRQIAMLYTSDPEVVSMTALVLRLYAFVQPAQSTQFIYAAALRGAGDAKWALYSTAIGIWGGRVIIGYILIEFFGMAIMGAWLGMAADQLGRSFVTSLRFGTGRWKSRKV
ncbi:MAG: MATE family efflux transporter [Bacillota bacterium]|nr:MATE family efflux transporter [Bacillota bacterium]